MVEAVCGRRVEDVVGFTRRVARTGDPVEGRFDGLL